MTKLIGRITSGNLAKHGVVGIPPEARDIVREQYEAILNKEKKSLFEGHRRNMKMYKEGLKVKEKPQMEWRSSDFKTMIQFKQLGITGKTPKIPAWIEDRRQRWKDVEKLCDPQKPTPPDGYEESGGGST